MEKKGLSLGHIRALLVAQDGRCAISGLPLDPSDVNGDHIIPISRSDLLAPPSKQNMWLVVKKINAMKGTFTYDELVKVAYQIVEHEERSRYLLRTISEGEIGEIAKDVFDDWVKSHCDDQGRVQPVNLVT